MNSVHVGRGNRIDGKVPTSSMTKETSAPATATGAGRQTTGGLKSGTVVFGGPSTGDQAGDAPALPSNRLAARRAAKATGNGSNGIQPSQSKIESKQPAEDESKFKPFQGSGRSLKD